MSIFLRAENPRGLTEKEILNALEKSLAGRNLKKVLLIGPDYTRLHSNAGFIINRFYHLLKEHAEVDIMPALGTHRPMTEEEVREMYGDIPYDKFLVHNWREGLLKLGEVPAAFIREITEGLWNESLACEVNEKVVDTAYDLVISVGQVVPHEVIGMANHAKNIFVGCGGADTINKTHMIGAVYGMERMMGKDHTPVRKILDYCWENFLDKNKYLFVLTVTTAPEGKIRTHGLFIGHERDVLDAAVALSQETNIDFLERGIKKCLVYLDPREFKSTWLGNKAIYRTRMAMADGGELIVLAPGVSRFGEDEDVDKLIRKYGYCGRLKVLDLVKENRDLYENLGTAAHLIHSSSDGRFKITYAVKNLTKEEVEGVHFAYADYEKIAAEYEIDKLKPGWNWVKGEEVYFIPNPALGLWIDKNRF
ncbi:MAG: lactate racemase domain-containing protein [Bacilli bacterium]